MNAIFKSDIRKSTIKGYSLVNWLTELYETNLEPELNYHLIWLSKQSLVKKGLVYLLVVYSPFLLINLSPYLLHIASAVIESNVNLITSSWLTLSDSPIMEHAATGILQLNSSSEEFPSVNKENVSLNKTVKSITPRSEYDAGFVETSLDFWRVKQSLHRWLMFVQEEKILGICKGRWSVDEFNLDLPNNLNLLNVFNWEERQVNLNFLMELKDCLMREDKPYRGLESFLRLNVEDNLLGKLRSLESLRSSGKLDEFIQLVIENIKLNDYMVKSQKIHQEMQVSLDNLINVLKEMNLLNETKNWEDVSIQGWTDYMLTSLRDMEVRDDQVDYQKLRRGIVYSHHLRLDKILDLVDEVETGLSSVLSEQDLSVKEQDLIRTLIRIRDGNDQRNILGYPPLSLKLCYSWDNVSAWRRECLIEDYSNHLNETLTEVKSMLRESLNDEKFSWLGGYYCQEDELKLRIIEKLNLLKNNLDNLSSDRQVKGSENTLMVRSYTKFEDWNGFTLSIEGKLKEVNQLLHQVIGQGEQSHVAEVFKETNRIRDLIDKAKKI